MKKRRDAGARGSGRSNPLKVTREDLRRLNEDLEQRVAERTRELSEAVERLQAEVQQRAEAEEAVRRSEARLRRVINANVIGVFTADSTGRIHDANSAFLKAVGYSQKDLAAGKLNWKQMTPLELRAQDEFATPELRRSGVGPAVEKVFLHRKGRRVPVLISVALVDRKDPKGLGVAFVVDETRRHELQKQLLEIADRTQMEFAHELHDGVCQLLAGAKFQSKLLLKKIGSLELAEQTGAAKVDQMVNEALEASYRLLQNLQPVGPDDQGLAPALQELADHIAQTFGARCEFAGTDAASVSDARLRMHLYRIAHQAAANAAQHGRADRITIRLTQRKGRLSMTITDNGSGFEPSHPGRSRTGRGMGLNIMRYRARLIGARLDVRSRPGRGTVVECSVT